MLADLDYATVLITVIQMAICICSEWKHFWIVQMHFAPPPKSKVNTATLLGVKIGLSLSITPAWDNPLYCLITHSWNKLRKRTGSCLTLVYTSGRLLEASCSSIPPNRNKLFWWFPLLALTKNVTQCWIENWKQIIKTAGDAKGEVGARKRIGADQRSVVMAIFGSHHLLSHFCCF